MKRESKIYVAGHRGLVGSAIWKNLQSKGYSNLLGRTRTELDLTDQHAVNTFFATEQPEYVFLAAAHVGGIMANNLYRADFIYKNIMIQNNVIHAAWKYGVKKLLFLGSTCIYPREAPQPMPEDCLLTSPLEYTNEPYAIAKIAGIKMCESYNIQYKTNFVSIMPTNLYGLNDNFDLTKSHVLPAMIRKIHLANLMRLNEWDAVRKDLSLRPVDPLTISSSKEEIETVLASMGVRKEVVRLWGTGKPAREFLWSEDMADASVYIMERINFEDVKPLSGEVRNTHINIGTGIEHSIQELAYMVKETINYPGKIEFDTSKPDGTMRKLTDVRKLHSFGWQHKIELEEGVRKLFQWYKDN